MIAQRAAEFQDRVAFRFGFAEIDDVFHREAAGQLAQHMDSGEKGTAGGVRGAIGGQGDDHRVYMFAVKQTGPVIGLEAGNLRGREAAHDAGVFILFDGLQALYSEMAFSEDCKTQRFHRGTLDLRRQAHSRNQSARWRQLRVCGSDSYIPVIQRDAAIAGKLEDAVGAGLQLQCLMSGGVWGESGSCQGKAGDAIAGDDQDRACLFGSGELCEQALPLAFNRGWIEPPAGRGDGVALPGIEGGLADAGDHGVFGLVLVRAVIDLTQEIADLQLWRSSLFGEDRLCRLAGAFERAGNGLRKGDGSEMGRQSLSLRLTRAGEGKVGSRADAGDRVALVEGVAVADNVERAGHQRGASIGSPCSAISFSAKAASSGVSIPHMALAPGSTATVKMLMPFSRKRSCSSPSSAS